VHGRGRPEPEIGRPSRYHDLTSPAPTTVRPVKLPARTAPGRSSHLSPRTTKAVIAFGDVLVLSLAMFAAMVAATRTGGAPSDLQDQVTKQLAFLSLPVWLGAMLRLRLYQSRFLARRSQEFRRIVGAAAVGSASILVISDLGRKIDVQRDFVFYSFVFGVTALMIEREVVRRGFSALRRRGHRLRPVAIIGDNAEGQELRRMFDAHPELGFRFMGFLTVEPHRRYARPEDVLGSVDEVTDVLARRKISSVMIAASAVDVALTSSLIRRLLNAGVNVELSPTLPDIAAERLTIRALGRFPVMYLEPFHQSGWRSAAKRLFDFCGAFVGLLMLSLPLLVVSALIKLDSRGPVFYRQQRVGKGGRLFDVVKFRTMVPNAHALRNELVTLNEADGPLFKIRNDPRVTRVGRFLRKTSIDELPQLWNVLRGEMSLVGPRPALPEEAALWSADLRDRLRVQPGITGMWQVSGRSNTSFEEYSRLDLYYVDNWSLLTDLSILGKTLPSVLLQRGAS
jgi:exopolysaccharide biosynthesis polyprenyl glycosylphosphotransferase